jgi:polyphenol oxidase
MGHAGRWVAVDEVDPAVAARRRAVCDLPWSWLRQVHGARVVAVDEPGAGAGEAADASVTAAGGAALAVLTADCAPVAIVAAEGIAAVAHAGWRGLTAGVLERTAEAVREAGGTELRAALGPCIHVECYEFGGDEMQAVVDRLGVGVRGVTVDGRMALDLPAGVRTALHEAGIDDVDDVDVCTSCSADHWSHRARGDTARQALVLWKTSSTSS